MATTNPNDQSGSGTDIPLKCKGFSTAEARQRQLVHIAPHPKRGELTTDTAELQKHCKRKL